MSLLPILIYGDPRLRQAAKPVAEVTDEIRRLAADMIETMYDAPGRGLAAPQVGQSLRLFVMDCQWKDGADRAPTVVVNPEIVAFSEITQPCMEGCLSIPDITVEVERPAKITMCWQDLDGCKHERAMDGFEAVCAQHEYDHLEGVLNTDRVSPEISVEIADALAALAVR